jgi:cytochrome P450
MNDQGFDANFIATDDGRDPYPEYVKLREHTPVARQESMFEGAPPSYLVYRHADVTQLLRDGETFSSAAIAEGMRDVWGRKIIVGMDEPEHLRQRAAVSGGQFQGAVDAGRHDAHDAPEV